ncbi:hypothetical protein Cgig2_004557 [Carnegiea gigantea]|uniref:Peptidase C1A papain C-terminal domain-containing protein n=1 Tax=Carnegiea gigantea TaxID=171969 RepID=A0A9Q1JGX5_9CARY|nr:hypothetical protein Cgig2_004557 [Carnegiea gigantea]
MENENGWTDQSLDRSTKKIKRSNVTKRIMESAAKVDEIVLIEDLDDNELLTAVSKHPVAGSIPFFDSLVTYEGGILWPAPTDLKYTPSNDSEPSTSRHGITIVVYGSENGIHFWKCLSSWGNKWGENDSFRIPRKVSAPELYEGKGKFALLTRHCYARATVAADVAGVVLALTIPGLALLPPKLKFLTEVALISHALVLCHIENRDKSRTAAKMKPWQGYLHAVVISLAVWFCREAIFECLQWWQGRAPSDGLLLGVCIILIGLACISIVALHFSHFAKRCFVLVVATGLLFVLLQPPLPISWTYHSHVIKAAHQIRDDISIYGSPSWLLIVAILLPLAAVASFIPIKYIVELRTFYAIAVGIAMGAYVSFEYFPQAVILQALIVLTMICASVFVILP